MDNKSQIRKGWTELEEVCRRQKSAAPDFNSIRQRTAKIIHRATKFNTTVYYQLPLVIFDYPFRHDAQEGTAEYEAQIDTQI